MGAPEPPPPAAPDWFSLALAAAAFFALTRLKIDLLRVFLAAGLLGPARAFV